MKERKYQIELKQGDFIEQAEDFEKSVFGDLYGRADTIIQKIVEEDRNTSELKNGNILAFLGERGSGKTTAMMSFMNSLKLENLKKRKRCFGEDVHFIIFDAIDASILEPRETLFKTILANMFAKIHDVSSEDNRSIYGRAEFMPDTIPYKQDLLKEIEEIYKASDNMRREKKEEDLYNNPLYSMRKLFFSGNLRDKFSGLVRNYIKYINGNDTKYDSNEKTYLVFAIDDLDMNMDQGFQMLTEIQRYLLPPYVIVLITAKYEQLEYLGSRGFSKIFANIRREMEKWQVAYLDQTSMEYLEKILPIHHRLYMPSFINIMTEYGRRIDIKKEKCSIKKALLGKIYRRIDVYFDGHREGKHYLEPISLRELNDYYCFLEELPRLNKDKKGSEEYEEIYWNNFDKFIKDFIYRYAVERLGVRSKKWFDEFVMVPIWREINYIMELACIELEKKYFIRPCYGNMLFLLYRLEMRSQENRNLAQCILTLYSLMINKQIFISSSEDDKQTYIAIKENEEIKQMLFGSWFGKWSEYIYPDITMLIGDELERRKIENINKIRANGRETLKYQIEKFREIPDVVNWMINHSAIMRALETILFLFEGFYDERQQREELKLRIVFSQNNDKDTQNISIRIDNNYADFNIFAFTKNVMYYEENLRKIHRAFIKAFLERDTDKIKKETISEDSLNCYLKGYYNRTEERERLKEFSDWAEKSQGMVLPVQYTDIYLELLKDLSSWSQEHFSGENALQETWTILQEICRHISQYLSEVDKFNLECGNQSEFEKNFDNCPILKYIYKPEEIGGISFQRQFSNMLQNYSKSNYNEDQMVLPDSVRTSAEPEMQEIL